MRMRIGMVAASLAAAGLILILTGCFSCSVKQNPQQLKEKTAETTAALKSDAKAVASGVREGWSRDKPLDVNHATRAQLESLPGISAATADRIIANRPYAKRDDLLSRGILTRREYERISDQLTAKK
ncbi:MAG TPA: helix-hairpin-helix domain-containing protein [Candidatus Sulfotelmatobacter sp.]|nr:helix-hairpin-helix domain-containing protein [Candidatus Sulfotelmatobacter sp.]